MVGTPLSYIKEKIYHYSSTIRKYLLSCDSSIPWTPPLQARLLWKWHLSSLVQADTDYTKRSRHVLLKTLFGDFIGYLSVQARIQEIVCEKYLQIIRIIRLGFPEK